MVAQEPSVPEGSICTDAFQTFLNPGEGDARLGQHFAPLTIPCPPTNDGTVFTFTYHHNINEDEYSSATRVSIAVSHEGENPIDGISLWGAYGPESFQKSGCDQNPLVKDETEFYQAKADNSECDDHLTSPSKICYGIQSLDNLNKGEEEAIFSVFNDGGCVGSMTVEASISDLNVPNTVPGKCLKEIQPLCSSSSAVGAHAYLFGIIASSFLFVLLG